MELFLTNSIDAVMQWNTLFLYFFLFGSAVLENLFPPIPGDTITVFGAFLVGIGRLDFFLVYAATTLGSSVGFILLFYAGAFLEMEFFLNTRIKIFSSHKIITAEKWFSRYGYYVVVLNRFLPGVRSVISIVAGISGLNTMKVFFLSLLSAMAWNFLWIYSGYSIGNNWELVREKISAIIRNYNMAAGILLISAGIIYFGFRIFKKRRETHD
ncbi:MAG TPA: DedA family protein [Spirochaetota bacterium]|nr:DedA family protein [Spirochaetota bacterium]